MSWVAPWFFCVSQGGSWYRHPRVLVFPKNSGTPTRSRVYSLGLRLMRRAS